MKDLMQMKKVFAVGAASAMLAVLAGCGSGTAAVSEDTASSGFVPEDQSSYTHYLSDDGWDMSYDADLFAVNVQDDGEVDFTYQGECSGSDVVSVTYVKDVMPQVQRAEVMNEANAEASDLSDAEGFFGSDSLWAYTYSNDSDGEGSGLNDDYTFIEHNGGTIVIEVITHDEAGEEQQEAISDSIAGLLDTFIITDDSEQTEFDYVVGTYKISGEPIDFYPETIVFDSDHNGSMSADDMVWTSTKIILNNGNEYSYTVEGDTIYVQAPNDDQWIEYDKE